MQSISEIFRNLFKLLSKRTQWIFKKIQGMCKNCRAVFPSREYIAKEVGCSVRTVARALQLFQMNGWIVIKKRPYQSNVYFMDESLIELNLDNPKTFLKDEKKSENVPQNVPVLEVSIQIENTYTEKEPVKKVVFGYLPSFLKQPCLPERFQHWLYQNFSECALLQAIRNARWYEQNVKKIDNPEGYIRVMAEKYETQQQNGKKYT